MAKGKEGKKKKRKLSVGGKPPQASGSAQTPPRAQTPQTPRSNPQSPQPFAVPPTPPSRTTLEDVKSFAPFVTMHDLVARDPVLSPATFGEVDFSALLHFLRVYADPALVMAARTRTFSSGGQMNNMCWIATLWPLFFALSSTWTGKASVPSSRVVDVGHDEDTDLTVSTGEPLEQVQQQEQQQEQFSQTSLEDFITTHEDQSVMGKSGSVDNFRVISSLLSGELPVQVCRMLADTKGCKLEQEWLSKMLPKLMRYAHEHGLDNVNKGRLGSIHLLGLSRGDFAIAELDCIGSVEVGEDEKFTDESLRQFRRDEQQHWRRMKKKSSSYKRHRYENAELEKMLEDATAVVGSPRRYVVGELYRMTSPQGWDWYRSEEKSSNIIGTLRLLEYLLVALLGSQVRRWKINDIDERMARKKEEHARDIYFSGSLAQAFELLYKAASFSA